MSTIDEDILGDDPILMVEGVLEPVDDRTEFDDSFEGEDQFGSRVLSVRGSENDIWKVEP